MNLSKYLPNINNLKQYLFNLDRKYYIYIVFMILLFIYIIYLLLVKKVNMK